MLTHRLGLFKFFHNINTGHLWRYLQKIQILLRMGNTLTSCCGGARTESEALKDALSEKSEVKLNSGFLGQRYQFRCHGFYEGRYIPKPSFSNRSKKSNHTEDDVVENINLKDILVSTENPNMESKHKKTLSEALPVPLTK